MKNLEGNFKTKNEIPVERELSNKVYKIFSEDAFRMAMAGIELFKMDISPEFLMAILTAFIDSLIRKNKIAIIEKKDGNGNF